MDKYEIDSHKLMYHPERVAAWRKGEQTYPIYAEIAPFGGCNHRCEFCSFNYLSYKPIKLDTDVLQKCLTSMGQCGVKAVMYAGEGEPLLHPEIAKIIKYTKSVAGMDVAVTTNGVMFDKKMSEATIPYMSWIKVSVDAATPKTYAKLHGTSRRDFHKVLLNLEDAVSYRDKHNEKCTIGAQAILLPDNVEEIIHLADMVNTDYLVIKPFTGHPQRKGYNEADYSNIPEDIKNQLINHPKIIFREQSFHKLEVKRNYDKCYAIDFWTLITAKGEVYSCSNFLGGDPKHVYGNIYDQSFKHIWSNRRHLNIHSSLCRQICRMDKINEYLWELKNGKEHVNFI